MAQIGKLSGPLALTLILLTNPSPAQEASPGHDQAVGQQFHITLESLPEPSREPPSFDSAPVQVPRDNRAPIVPPGFSVALYLEGLPSPRRLLVDPGNVVYLVQQSVGGLIRMRDVTGDNVPDEGSAVLEGAANPFGLALVPGGPFAGDLLVTDQETLMRLPMVSGGTAIATLTSPGAFGQPSGHITRELAVDPETGAIYVAVGSMANIAEEPEVKATIQRFDADGANQRTFATGLRNTTGLAFEPTTGALYGVVMERDGMGDGLVPDFFTRIDDGDFFGWPYQYTGGFAQQEFAGRAPKEKAAELPDVLFEAHSSPLDVAFIPDTWPQDWRGDAIVALHGSWSRSTPTGYKLVRIHFKDGRPLGTYENFMTGFWVGGESPAEVWGRPAALAFAPDSALLVADDLGNTIWRVTPDGP